MGGSWREESRLPFHQNKHTTTYLHGCRKGIRVLKDSDQAGGNAMMDELVKGLYGISHIRALDVDAVPLSDPLRTRVNLITVLILSLDLVVLVLIFNLLIVFVLVVFLIFILVFPRRLPLLGLLLSNTYRFFFIFSALTLCLVLIHTNHLK
jgi:hypothetical protein